MNFIQYLIWSFRHFTALRIWSKAVVLVQLRIPFDSRPKGWKNLKILNGFGYCDQYMVANGLCIKCPLFTQKFCCRKTSQEYVFWRFISEMVKEDQVDWEKAEGYVKKMLQRVMLDATPLSLRLLKTEGCLQILLKTIKKDNPVNTLKQSS